jgi:hypothetical protein
MPKLSEIELRPNDILLPDVSDEAIERLRVAAAAANKPFSDYVLDLMALHFGTPREKLTNASVIVLDPE